MEDSQTHARNKFFWWAPRLRFAEGRILALRVSSTSETDGRLSDASERISHWSFAKSTRETFCASKLQRGCLI
jgi:hypothetical protein